MSFSIQTNANSLIAQENLRVNSNFQSQTIRRLTSGYRINQSGDDAAGLAVANKFRSDTAELTQGVRNANDGVSQLQIADGGMSNISKMLDRLKTLSAQSGSATFTGDRTVLNNEFSTLVGEIDRQASAIGLNTGGSFAASLSVYLGGGKGATNAALITNGTVTMDLSKATVDSASLGLTGMQTGNTGFDLSSSEIVLIRGNGTNVSNEAAAGFARFKIYGPGQSFTDGVNVDVAMSSSIVDATTLAAAINTAITAAGVSNTALASAAITASVVKDAATGNQVLQFSSAGTAFQVRAGDMMANAFMGYATVSSGLGNTVATTLSGAAYNGTFATADTLNVRIEGAGLTGHVDLGAITANTGGGSAVSTAALIQTAVAANAALAAAGITVSSTAGPLVFKSAQGGSLKVTISGDSANVLGFGSFVGPEATSFTAGTAYADPGASGNVILDLSLAGGSGQGALTVGLVKGTDTTSGLAVDKINAAIAAAGANSVFQKAGIIAVDNGGTNVQLVSTNGTLFRLGVRNAGANMSALGFYADSNRSAAAYTYTAPATPTALFNAQASNGAYQLGTNNTSAPLTFSAITYATDGQALTLSADANGANHSVVIALNQTNAKDIDEAIKAINTAIQGTTDATLKSIAAVKVNVSGTEEIQFVSAVQNFSLNVGATTNATGVTVPAGGTVSSTKVGTGGALDISTAAGANAAVTAITAAVGKLGVAQAAVGKGQNQLAYAIGLAQSQISSFSSAESQLRDADIAAEAANLTKASVLQQATMAAMAQANSAPQAVLALLRG